jgi:hypothetical protein
MLLPIWIIDNKRNSWIEWYFQFGNFTLFELSITWLEFLNVLKQYEIVTICTSLVSHYGRWDYYIKIAKFIALSWQSLKMMNLFHCQFGICRGSVIWTSKIWLFELYNYSIWFDTKKLNLNWSLVLRYLNMFLNVVIWIDFVKRNWIEKMSHWHKNSIIETFPNWNTKS